MVVLARSPGCPSRHEPPARSQGFPITAGNELARSSWVKSPALRDLDAAIPSPSHFNMLNLERLGTNLNRFVELEPRTVYRNGT